jgi:hypothetical protein
VFAAASGVGCDREKSPSSRTSITKTGSSSPTRPPPIGSPTQASRTSEDRTLRKRSYTAGWCGKDACCHRVRLPIPVRVRPGLVDLGRLDAIGGYLTFGVMSLVIFRAYSSVWSRAGTGTSPTLVTVLALCSRPLAILLTMRPLLELAYAQVSIGILFGYCGPCRQGTDCGSQPTLRRSAATRPAQYSGLASDPMTGDDG